jgi:hypothetical protein
MELIEEHIFEDLNPDITEKFILKNVKLIGVKSDNNRKYPIEVLRESKDLYHDVPVYIAHHKTGSKRLYTERIGVVKNPVCKDNGIYGELHLNPFHALSPAVQWDYEKNSKRVGLSHDADGLTEKGVVKKLTAVHSIDLVTEAATATSLREETEVNEIELIKTQLKELNTKLESMNKDNDKLLEQIQELGKRKPITSGAATYEAEKVNIDDWVKNLRKV